MSNTKATLTEMAQLTMLTGRISEVHFKNMQSFPFIFFNEVAEVELDYAIATNQEEESSVTYRLTLDLLANDQIDKRYKALENAIQTLFWKDVALSVQVNGQDAYKSE